MTRCVIINSKTGKQLGSEQFHESNEDLTLGALFNTLELPPSFSDQFNKPCVKFTVDVVTPTTSHAFNRLMAGSRRLFQMERQNRMPQLPAMKSSSSPGFTLLNHIIEDLLEKNGL